MLFGKKERHAEDLIKRHIVLVGEAVEALQKAIDGYCIGCVEFDQLVDVVHDREHEADQVRREVEMTLYDGAFMPMERGDYVALVERIDKIANGSEAAAEFMLLTHPELDEQTKTHLQAIVEATVRSYRHILEMHDGFEDGRVVLELAHKVEEEEQAVDRLFATAVRQLFDSELDLARKIHLKMLLDRIAAISNRVEDASDRFSVMVSKRP